jgi:hypothetical protein
MVEVGVLFKRPGKKLCSGFNSRASEIQQAESGFQRLKHYTYVQCGVLVNFGDF